MVTCVTPTVRCPSCGSSSSSAPRKLFSCHTAALTCPSRPSSPASPAQAKQGLDVVELLRHCEEAHGPAPPPLYCSLISRLLKHPGRGTPAKQAAYGVWRALRASGQRLDQVAYRTGMNLCVELGHIGEARRLMDAMRVAGFRPGWGAYHILMKYHASRGDMDGARRLFAQLRAYRGGKPLGE